MINWSNLKAVLFDLDGTLLNRDQSLASFLEHQYQRIPAFHAMGKQAFIRRFVELDQKGYVWKDRVYQSLVEEGQLELDWQELLADYVLSFRHHCIGFPGLIEMLEALKLRNYKLGIITNGFGDFQMNTIRGLGIEGYFDEILVSEIEGLRKPDIRIFQLALQRLGVRPEEAIFVGDHPVNDVEAGMHAGMLGIWKEEDGLGRPACAALTIRELPELLDMISA
ncbi:HAD family hydrolase [Paenibacillus sacheonensis]|uniref:HAD-IA family hydrolase n=1 Tax=Paenibacillus sacheonensis TaxID=742054 RepID=A0A7X5BYB6_9BACL|nr:HAD family hydrolase [Paenibacillus sacheonensis]MBM7565554.1 putative hydrolase of the HAD superfamily [Paenibacillus sacheonensis]NBC69527.1 HAD-IA family hydrolase [Paenibacillus sacheonensis]